MRAGDEEGVGPSDQGRLVIPERPSFEALARRRLAIVRGFDLNKPPLNVLRAIRIALRDIERKTIERWASHRSVDTKPAARGQLDKEGADSGTVLYVLPERVVFVYACPRQVELDSSLIGRGHESRRAEQHRSPNVLLVIDATEYNHRLLSDELQGALHNRISKHATVSSPFLKLAGALLHLKLAFVERVLDAHDTLLFVSRASGHGNTLRFGP